MIFLLLILFVSVFDYYGFLHNIPIQNTKVLARRRARIIQTKFSLEKCSKYILCTPITDIPTLFCHQIRKRSERACRELGFYTAQSLNKDEDCNLTI